MFKTTMSEYLDRAKDLLGDPNMPDAELARRLACNKSHINQARGGRLWDPVAIRLALVLNIDPGLMLWLARVERAHDPDTQRLMAAFLERLAAVAQPLQPHFPPPAAPHHSTHAAPAALLPQAGKRTTRAGRPSSS